MKPCPAIRIRPVAAFTMIEVAICLAIIGVALVGIIGVLPRGMNAQRENREETIISQDASMLIELVRNGSHGPDDLTNYVYAITNYWTSVDASGTTQAFGFCGYDYTRANPVATSGSLPAAYANIAPINNGTNIVSLLSTPELTDLSGKPIPSLLEGGISNHIVAYVRSISGLAVEKPPQNNPTMQGDMFSYRLLCVNAPMPMDLPPVWQASVGYTNSDKVYLFLKQWQWQGTNTSLPTDIPSQSKFWVRYNVYADQLASVQRELRLRFLWPQRPNGSVGNYSQVFRAAIDGQLATNLSNGGPILYFYQPQSFIRLP